MSPATPFSRDDAFFLAKVAEEAERWDDAIAHMKTLVNGTRAHLSAEERNLVSVAYKNKTGGLRNSWRTIDTLEKRETAAGRAASHHVVLMRTARTHIEQDLEIACQDLLRLLTDQLLPVARMGEETVFYSKMQGDYYRYLFEIASNKTRESYAQRSLDAYKSAYKHALGTLEPWHPTRLGLALNFAVYFRDVCASPIRACHLAKHAFDEAVATLRRLPEDAFRDSVMILQLLRDDLVLWSAEIGVCEEGEGAGKS